MMNPIKIKKKLIITAFLSTGLTACLPYMNEQPKAVSVEKPKPVVQSPAVINNNQNILIDDLIKTQKNFPMLVQNLESNQFSCELFENGLNAKMTRCQKEQIFNQEENTAKITQGKKLCTDTVWIEHQQNIIKKSQKFVDCQNI